MPLSPDGIYLCAFCSSSSPFLCDNCKWCKMESVVISTSTNLGSNYTVTLSGCCLQRKSRRLCSEPNWTDWLIYVCQVKGKETDKRKPRSVRAAFFWGGGGGGDASVAADIWLKYVGRTASNQTEINEVWETERKKFRHMSADLNPFSNNQYREMRVCVCAFRGSEPLSATLPIKIRNTVTLPQRCLTPLWPSNPCTCLDLILEPVIQ